MISPWLACPIDAHRWGVTAAQDILEANDATPEQLLKMLTAEVGHTDSEVIYTENTLELHRYDPATVGAEATRETPILIVYALVNRPYVLDLQPDRSVVRHLLEAGFTVYLLDWGEPSRLDRTLGLADYVCRYLDNCVDAALADAGVEDLHLHGYCMGGTMALMYATENDAKIRTLGLMATPIAFDGTGGILERWATHYDPEVAVETYGNVPGSLLALEFSMMDPIEHYVTKYVRLAENIEDDDFVENFARMERWIWDGVDVAGAAFREFVGDVYKRNQLIQGEFHLDGRRIDLAEITVPLLQIVGQYDHIVPAASSRPLHDEIDSPDDTLIEFPAGHVGLSVSSTAHADLWPAVADWYAARSPRDRSPVLAPDVDATAPIDSLDGIGPTYGDRLREAGVETVGALACRDSATLADLAEATEGRAVDWLDQVRVESSRAD